MTNSTNGKNRKIRPDNASGYTGIFINIHRGCVESSVAIKGKRKTKYFGIFDNIDRAISYALLWQKEMRLLDGNYTDRHGTLITLTATEKVRVDK